VACRANSAAKPIMAPRIRERGFARGSNQKMASQPKQTGISSAPFFIVKVPVHIEQAGACGRPHERAEV
jgi:hypothetical protein